MDRYPTGRDEDALIVEAQKGQEAASPPARAGEDSTALLMQREAGLPGGYSGAEDIDLWRRLRSAAIEPLADSSIVVATSGRRHGRVREGFAHALALAYPTDTT